MKKIFLLAISLPFLVCGGFYYDGARFQRDVQKWSSDLADNMHTLVERDHENYWLNNVRSFKTYPITWYGEHQNASEANAQVTLHHTQEYPRNVPISAYKGQRILGDETYTVTTSNMGEHYEVSSAGEIRNSSYRIQFHDRQVLNPVGETLINGRHFIVFEPERDGRMILADEVGQIMHNIAHYYRGELLLSKDLTTVMPKDLTAVKTSDVLQKATEPQLQFEIYYDGLLEEQMKFTYVDFINGRAEKTFVFPRDQQLIDINGKKFKVHQATNSFIEYIILN